MKVKALDSFATAETGMVHAGDDIDTTPISQDRLDAWAERGFIPKVKKDAEPQNKAEPDPDNKGGAKPARKRK